MISLSNRVCDEFEFHTTRMSLSTTYFGALDKSFVADSY